MILTGRQFREGRLLTGMSQVDLARYVGVALGLVVKGKAVDGMAMMRKLNVGALRFVLEATGVEFIPENGGGAGVKLQKVVLE